MQHAHRKTSGFNQLLWGQWNVRNILLAILLSLTTGTEVPPRRAIYTNRPRPVEGTRFEFVMTTILKERPVTFWYRHPASSARSYRPAVVFDWRLPCDLLPIWREVRHGCIGLTRFIGAVGIAWFHHPLTSSRLSLKHISPIPAPNGECQICPRYPIYLPFLFNNSTRALLFLCLAVCILSPPTDLLLAGGVYKLSSAAKRTANLLQAF